MIDLCQADAARVAEGVKGVLMAKKKTMRAAAGAGQTGKRGAAAQAAELGRRVLITLDGPCASGKTTLAGRLAKALHAAVLHTDHFVVPHERKTAERLRVPGGNCDWERLTSEVLIPWKGGRAGTFRR